jgi:ribose transport system ATP-binding protein
MEAEGLERGALVRTLLAHEIEEAEPRTPRTGGKVMVSLSEVSGGRAGPVTFDLRAGQVTGLTGLPGSGLHDVAHLVNGSMAPTAGTIERQPCRTAFVPPNRESEGGFDDLSVLENMTISALPEWSKGSVLRHRPEWDSANGLVDQLGVNPADPDAYYGTLSGGNKQKVIFGRALLRHPGVYVLCEPTRGVDIATRAAIYRLISTLVDEETAVLVVSSDAEDLFAVCDELAVVEEGTVGRFLRADETNPQEMEAFI